MRVAAPRTNRARARCLSYVYEARDESCRAGSIAELAEER